MNGDGFSYEKLSATFDYDDDNYDDGDDDDLTVVQRVL